MSSVVPGFEYDIFISYRQKDNKYDGWVTEFADNLKRELEATFKEEINVYFDVNPEHGLLETHDVDESLREKLKCLIFIPIISQTYCDTKSFAWKHEFKEFIGLASADRFGLKVKLAGGNVAGRILPVRIHDLDDDDRELLEKELGGKLRSVDFIYRSAGVNRPLRSNEEHPERNLNNIIYRDQINKVANAVKEIINALVTPGKPGSQTFSPKIHPKRKLKKPRIITGITIFILIILIFGTQILSSKNKLSNSIIVLPFSTRDTSQTYFANGITVDVITELAKVGNISTLSWNTSESYLGSKKSLKDIAGETGVTYVLSGVIQREDQKIRVNVELVNPATGKNIWAQSWDNELKYVFDIQKQIARDVAKELGVKLSSYETARIGRYSTRNFEAYDLFLKARAESRLYGYSSEHTRLGNRFLQEVLSIDPNFPQALTLRANNIIDLAWKDGEDPMEAARNAKELLGRSLALDPGYSDTYIVLGTVNWFLEWDFTEAEKNLEKGWELSNFGEIPISQCYCGIIEFDMLTGNFQNALTLLGKVEKIDPEYPYSVPERSIIYSILNDTASMRELLKSYTGPGFDRASLNYRLGNYEEAIKGLLKENTQDPDVTPLLGSSYYKAGYIEKSDSIISKLIDRSRLERNIDFQLAVIYGARGDKENAIKWFKSAYTNHDLGLSSTLFRIDLRLIIHEPEVRQILRNMGILNESTSGI